MKEKLTIKERITLKLLFLAMEIVNPFKYSHELTNPLKEIEKLIKDNE